MNQDFLKLKWQALSRILKIFDPLAVDLINSSNIDRPANALTLTDEFRALFTNFDMGFEQVQDSAPLHAYKIEPYWSYPGLNLPITRTLALPPDGSIEPPSPILLRVHAAIGRITHSSGAWLYINRVVRDVHDMSTSDCVARIVDGSSARPSGDGSTRLDVYVKYKLGRALIPLF